MSLLMNKEDRYVPDEKFLERTARRLEAGEAYMICNECGGKLYSFDGSRDADRSCPYRRDGKCQPR